MAKQHPINKLNHKLRKEYKQAIKADRALRHSRAEFNWASLFAVRRATGVMMGLLAITVLLFYLVTREDKGPPPPPTYPAAGHISVSKGPPITGGLIELRSWDSAAVRQVRGKAVAGGADTSLTTAGEINSDGSFTLHTLRRRHRAEGAPEGEYKVTIVPEASGRTGRPIVLPDSYNIRPEKNDLNIVVSWDPKKK